MNNKNNTPEDYAWLSKILAIITYVSAYFIDRWAGGFIFLRPNGWVGLIIIAVLGFLSLFYAIKSYKMGYKSKFSWLTYLLSAIALLIVLGAIFQIYLIFA